MDKVSQMGFSKNSPYKGKNKLKIKSSDITMRDTEFPLLGVSSEGESKLMLPGQDYHFNNADYVMEYKLKKGGYLPLLQNYLPTLPEDQQDQLLDTLNALPEQEKYDYVETMMNGGCYKCGGKMEGGGLSRAEDYGSKKKPYPSVKGSDFAGGHRSYPIPTKADAIDALRLAGLHGREDVRAKVFAKYPELKKEYGGEIEEEYKKGGWIQKAVNPKHKGFCTPMTKSTCTPRRKAFAMTMKKHHGFHEEGGQTPTYPELDLMNLSEGTFFVPDNKKQFLQYILDKGYAYDEL